MKRKMTRTDYTHDGWLNVNDEDVEGVVAFRYYPGTPGRTSGPPEDCYESEPAGIELHAFTVDGADILPTLTSQQCDDLTRRLWDDFDAWRDDYDYRY